LREHQFWWPHTLGGKLYQRALHAVLSLVAQTYAIKIPNMTPIELEFFGHIHDQHRES
jgi:hypothetical protein